MKIINDLYNRHISNIPNNIKKPHGELLAEAWFNEDTVDSWRHIRMYEVVNILRTNTDAKWLTIGDGRFGLDSIRLRKLGIKNVIPSNISGELLEKSKKDGLISEYKVINAEKMINLEDDSFDYVFCKESYHHFPRPPIAFYEMLRIAKKAVVLIEPNEGYHHIPSRVKYIIKKVLRKQRNFDEKNYEPVGNYKYCISTRELEKMASAINLSTICYKGINDYYIKGVEFEKAEKKSKLFRRVKRKIFMKNILVKLGINRWDLLMCVISKESLSNEIRELFIDNNWKIKYLPVNPYISR